MVSKMAHMTPEGMLGLMADDIANEYTHMLFYLASASSIRGLHRREIGEWLEGEAASEMGHVLEFSKLISSLGRNPGPAHRDFPVLTNPEEIVRYAIGLEQEVSNNYAVRIRQAGEAADGSPDPESHAAWTNVSLFYEDQLRHSHTDLNELREWVKKFD